jgi:hypothetical protein
MSTARMTGASFMHSGRVPNTNAVLITREVPRILFAARLLLQTNAVSRRSHTFSRSIAHQHFPAPQSDRYILSIFAADDRIKN